MPRGENRHSVLLSPDENEQVFSLIGPKCQSLATAVVQLYTTEGPAHSEWKKRDTGVLCLIKDNGRRSYFFRIYCLYRKTMIWEHEVYMQIEYKSPRPYLHTFEAEEYMTAFNFASEEDAIILRNVLLEKIEQRKSGQRSQKRRQKSMGAVRPDSQDEVQLRRPNGSLPPPPAAPRVTEPEPTPMPTPLKTINSNTNKLKSSKRRGKIKITKADIGKPHNFQHISHVGWDANKGFDVETLQPQSEELRSFFSKAGVSEKQLRDQATREFIYSFIEINGGLDAVKEDLHTNQIKPQRSASNRVAGVGCSPSPPAMPLPAPPVPARSPAPTHPPAPPSRTPPPPPPSRAVPPPPPPVAVAQRNPPPPRPLQPPSSVPPSVPPPPPPGSAPPPPPPPPPAPAPPPPPAAPPMPEPEDSAVPTDMRAALMASIRSGSKTLKRVEVNKPAVDDSRSNLLSEIRQGVELKSVSRSESNTGTANRPVAAAPVCGLAGALARALQERSRAIHSDSDDMSDETTSDGEWDD